MTATDVTATQKLPLPTLTTMVVGSMVGAGVFSLPRNFAQATGIWGALIAWLITRPGPSRPPPAGSRPGCRATVPATGAGVLVRAGGDGNGCRGALSVRAVRRVPLRPVGRTHGSDHR